MLQWRQDEPCSSENGLTLLELVVALSILAVVFISAGMTLIHGMQYGEESFEMYRAMTALRDAAAEIQETANWPDDLARGIGLGAVYGKYHQRRIPISGLEAGEITVVCFPDEARVPAELGGPQDLNFDGDAQDNLGNISAGSDLKLVPLSLTARFTRGDARYVLPLYRLVTRTAK